MLRVLDLTRRSAGGFATMLLCRLGAEVVRVERDAAPDAASADHLDEFERLYCSQGKRLVKLDRATRKGRRTLLELVQDCDAVVEDEHPGETECWNPSYRLLRSRRPGIVLTSITPFGRRGPRSRWKASELVQQAMGGLVSSSGHNEEPPQRLGGSQAAHAAGLQAAIMTLAAVRGVRSGREGGVHLDVSIQEVMATHWTREIGRYVYTGEGTGRPSARLGLQGFPHTALASDGYLFLLALRADWEGLAHFLGLEQFITHEWSEPETRIRRWDEIEPHFHEALRQRGRYAWFEAGAARGWTLAPVDDPLSVLASPQLAARGFFERGTAPTTGRELALPGLPFKLDGGQGATVQ